MNAKSVTKEELTSYIDFLEKEVEDLKLDLDFALTEARSLRRSIAAYKANSTRRKTKTNTSTEVVYA